MTKPSKSSTKSETSKDLVPEDSPQAKKEPAKPDVIATADSGAGTGKSVAATGGEVKPAESTLVGKAENGIPAAEVRPAKAGAGAESAKSDKPEPAKPEPAKDGTKPVMLEKSAKADSPTEPASRPASQPEKTPAPVQNVTVQKTGFWQVLFGGVVAAGLGAGATYYWAMQQPPRVDPAVIEAQAISAAEAAARRIAEESAANQQAPQIPEEITQLPARIDAVEAALNALPGDQGVLPALQAALEAQAERIVALEAIANAAPVAAGDDALGQTVARLQAQIAQQAGQIDQLVSRPAISPEVAAQVQALAGQADALQQQIQAAAQQAQSQIAEAQAEAARLQEAAQDSTRRAQAVAAVAALQAALDRGVTAEDAKQALAGAGLDAPEALQRDVPSLEGLQASFGEAARASLRATLREDSTQGGNVLTNFLRAQVGARSVQPREGDDADAILSRANALVEAGDIAGALTEMAALPEPAATAPAMAQWLTDAAAYRDAHAALNDLSAETN
ncbi:hypothetical protein [Paracoccus sp. (in: a-proteobacteria)]|uniref:COG4223 family protein n=1 Tax=Paracoccus sp. TaxID=267 RepID=UPI003A8581F6